MSSGSRAPPEPDEELKRSPNPLPWPEEEVRIKKGEKEGKERKQGQAGKKGREKERGICACFR